MTPSTSPVSNQTINPSSALTSNPSVKVTLAETEKPSAVSSMSPTLMLSTFQTHSVTSFPSINPSNTPSDIPTHSLTHIPTITQSLNPTISTSSLPIFEFSSFPTKLPTNVPSTVISMLPTFIYSITSSPSKFISTVEPSHSVPTHLPSHMDIEDVLVLNLFAITEGINGNLSNETLAKMEGEVTEFLGSRINDNSNFVDQVQITVKDSINMRRLESLTLVTDIYIIRNGTDAWEHQEAVDKITLVMGRDKTQLFEILRQSSDELASLSGFDIVQFTLGGDGSSEPPTKLPVASPPVNSEFEVVFYGEEDDNDGVFPGVGNIAGGFIIAGIAVLLVMNVFLWRVYIKRQRKSDENCDENMDNENEHENNAESHEEKQNMDTDEQKKINADEESGHLQVIHELDETSERSNRGYNLVS